MLARHIVLVAMHDSYTWECESIQNTKGIHERLEKEFADPSLVKKTLAMKKYNDLKLPERGKIADNVHAFRALVRELEAIHMRPNEPMQVLHLLNTLLVSWDVFVASLAARETAPRLEELVTLLKAEEERKNAHNAAAPKDVVHMVGPLAVYYQVPLRHILLIYDEMSLPNGVLRLQAKGGHGYHNGMKSVMDQLDNSREFPRLSIGIGNHPGTMDMRAYLLQKFSAEEREQINAALKQGVEGVRSLVFKGFDDSINRFNLRQKYKYHKV
ncbi:peptidyl-tRNA hydrolase isoform X1 [Amborella trichopoda]|uniref:peptidyl-tRNA hydrolase isoform X1 n=1 Tax=Amborella trichopoda TaxID=13333 RepID=UPI0009BEBC4C|nr:peptidyl-tRNA hydrolase isoform X1 [Amborella trichopoda]|eukprot:XP_020531569.1 peptidyl-tRNA hydrolase isoform X1 [Amborella trichopoda]